MGSEGYFIYDLPGFSLRKNISVAVKREGEGYEVKAPDLSTSAVGRGAEILEGIENLASQMAEEIGVLLEEEARGEDLTKGLLDQYREHVAI